MTRAEKYGLNSGKKLQFEVFGMNVETDINFVIRILSFIDSTTIHSDILNLLKNISSDNCTKSFQVQIKYPFWCDIAMHPHEVSLKCSQ